MNILSQMYTLEKLKEVNLHYDREYNVKASDVEKVNELIKIISLNRTDFTPRVGDIVRYTNSNGEYYEKACIDAVYDNGEIYVCENPSNPFVWKNEMGTDFSASVSGGAFAYIPKDIKCVGVEEKFFQCWGWCGPCRDGSVKFLAKVMVWEYNNCESEFTTKNYDKFSVSIDDDENRKPDEYKYFISRRGVSSRAFKTDEDYARWLKNYHGVENMCNSRFRTVWTYKQKTKYAVEKEVFDSIENAIIGEELSNGRMVPVKRVIEGTTITTYFLDVSKL